MVEEIEQNKQDYDQVDLPEFAEIRNAQGMVGKGGDQPEPKRNQQAGRCQTALGEMSAQPLRHQDMDEDACADQTVTPVIQAYRQAEGGHLLESQRLGTGKDDGKQKRRQIQQQTQTAEQPGVGAIQPVKVQAEDHHRRHREIIENGAEQRVKRLGTSAGPDTKFNQPGPQCIE